LALVAAVVLVLLVKGGHARPDVYHADFGEIVRGEYGATAGLWWIMLNFNVLLFLFNMIPIPPLDGFSVLDGTFELGDFGARVRGAGMFVFVVAVLIANSDAFHALRDHVAAGMILLVRDCVRV
jgi:Zn-dependent protease